MEHKIKYDITPGEICAIVFAPMAIIYGILGYGLLGSSEAEDRSAAICLFIMAAGFLLISVILAIYGTCKRHKMQNIYSQGHYVLGEIADIIPNYTVRINGHPMYTVMVRYVDRSGNIHSFRSHNQRKIPDRSIIGKTVKVYYENEKFKHYYIDLTGVLPKVIEH